ncbi:regulator of G-protein signaling 4-like [Salvelinus fontinalis]|uniref:regulator of G-protein signaling 4-like n=1 Tax=Salvelinus fontinalis TaxID=8038 RepID=UPI0024859B5A|nr:regulator of G-protein signaling 4-like [Salvelinus fontinalis]
MCKGLATLPATCMKSAKDIKHKIGFLLHKPEFPPDKEPIKEKTNIAKRVSPADVEKWKLSFNNLMNSEAGRMVFTTFLKAEFSEENMEFWKACEKYKMSAPKNMAGKAKQIYDQYVAADALNEVNLDSATREETRQNLSNAGPFCFDNAQQKIFTLMEKDSYRRFLYSKLIQDLSPLPNTTQISALEKRGGMRGCSENGGA